MLGTFGSALEARKINASGGVLSADATGDIVADGNVLIIAKIHVRLRFLTSPENLPIATRVHDVYVDKCPVYRTLKNSIAITSELIFEDGQR